MSETRQHVDAAFPRQRRAGGVMGYVAELQQFDTQIADGDDPTQELPGVAGQPSDPTAASAAVAAATAPSAPDERSSAGERPAAGGDGSSRAAAPGDAVSYDDLADDPLAYYALLRGGATTVAPASGHAEWSAGAAGFDRLPAAGLSLRPGAVVPAGSDAVTQEHPRVAAPRARRTRVAVLAGLVAALLAGGAAYLLLHRPAEAPTASPPPRVQLPPPVDTGAPFSAPVPGFAPGQRTAEPSASVSGTPAASASARPSAARVVPGGTARGSTSPRPAGSSAGAPARTTKPPNPPGGAPAPGPPPPQGAPAQPPPLDARFTRTADDLPLGLTGYVGTLLITNPGRADNAGWQVTLTVPGGNVVSSDGAVDVVQDGERVTFNPRSGIATVPAKGSVTFSFSVRGVLPGEPSNCAIDGRACN